MGLLHRCVEMLIKEQMRKYKVKMEEISQLEAAESIAFRRLSLLRQNTVSTLCVVGSSVGVVRIWPGWEWPGEQDLSVRVGSHFAYHTHPWPQAVWSGANSYLNQMITTLSVSLLTDLLRAVEDLSPTWWYSSTSPGPC